MANEIDSRSTKGDRQFPLRWTLQNYDGTAATLSSVTLRMVNVADNSVKLAAGACTIVGNVVEYAWAASDVDTVGKYALQMTDTTGGKTARWPTGREHIHQIVDVIG